MKKDISLVEFAKHVLGKPIPPYFADMMDAIRRNPGVRYVMHAPKRLGLTWSHRQLNYAQTMMRKHPFWIHRN